VAKKTGLLSFFFATRERKKVPNNPVYEEATRKKNFFEIADSNDQNKWGAHAHTREKDVGAERERERE